MPIVEYFEDRPTLTRFRTPERPPVADALEPGPTAMELLGAAFRQDNTVGSSIANKMAGLDLSEREEGFTGATIWDDIQGTKYEAHADRLLPIFNRRGLEAMKSQIDMEAEDRKTLDAGGWGGVAASMGAAVLDLPSLLPGGAIVRGVKGGIAIGRTAFAGGAAGALAGGVSEAALQATQETRPISDSMFNIGAGAVLGATLGAGIGAVFTKAERAAALRSVELAQKQAVGDPLGEFRAGIVDALEFEPGREAQSGGAAAVDKPVLEDYGIAKGARALGSALSPLNPLLRAAQSPSAVHRSIMADMAETGFYLEKNTRGEGNIAVESAVKYWDRGALSKGITEFNGIYHSARKDGVQMTPEEFRIAVAKAMRRGDESDVPAVADAARMWRKTLFDPLKEEAIAVGRLPADVSVKTATSYLSRLWNPMRLNAGEAKFKQIVRPWMDSQLAEVEFKAEEIKIGNKIVDAEKSREAFDKVSVRLDGIEGRAAERAEIRNRKVNMLESVRRDRADVLKERAPPELVKMLRNADENTAMVEAVKEARKTERAAPKSFGEKFPVLHTIREKGGVRIGTQLDSALRSMGVTPKTHPGLFKNGKGLGDVDNFVISEDDVFAGLPDAGNGYADPNDILDAISSELGGNPLRSAAREAADATADDLARVADEWLAKVGLDPNASVKDVRDFINRVMGAEKNTEGLDSRMSRLEREIEEFDQTTDKISNERLITEAEAKTIREDLNALETELDAVTDLANASPRVKLVVDYATTKRDLFKAKLTERTLRKRVDALKRLDAEGNANDDILAELAAKQVDLDRLGAEIDGLKTKADKLEPMVPKVKQELPDFVSPADRADYVNGIVDDIFQQLTGRANQGMPSYDMTVSARGPLKERTFNIPDELVEDFLEHDIELIARRYARVMAADVELARMDTRLGGTGNPTLQAQVDRMAQDYLILRENVMASDLEPPAKEKALAELAKREKSDKEDLAGVRDLLRGQYKVDAQHTNFAKVLRTAGTFNYMRSLGGVLVSSAADAVRPAMVHGMGRYMSEGIIPLVTNLKAIKMAVADATRLGAVTERTLQSRIATMAELADPYAANSPFERFMDNMANRFSKLTLLPIWNDFHKSISSVLVQNRVLENALGDFRALDADELKYMGYVGIDEDMAPRVSAMFKAHGSVEQPGNVHVPGMENWDDEGAKRAFAAAVNKDVDSIIVTKSVADVPLFAHTPAGRALLQFRTFALASHQRVLMRGMQESHGKFMTSLVALTAFGMIPYAMKAWESGRDLSNNPGTWVAEGLERSGVFAVGFEINNVWEKLGGPGFFALASAGGRMVDPAADKRQPASRFANRDMFGALLGPTFQLGTDAAQLLGIPARGLTAAIDGDPETELDISPADINRAGQMIPFLTLPYWRWIIEGGFGLEDAPFRGVEPELKALVE